MAPFALNGGEVAIGSRIGATPAGGAFQGVRADWLIQQVAYAVGQILGMGERRRTSHTRSRGIPRAPNLLALLRELRLGPCLL